MNTGRGYKAEYEKAVQRELELSHALSRMHMQLEEKNEMFQQAVDFGERLQQELEDLNKELTYQFNKSSELEDERNVLRERVSILDSTVREMRLAGFEAQHALQEASRTTVQFKAELDLQKELSSLIQDDFVIARKNENDRTVGVNETITRLRSEVTNETLGRLKAEEMVSQLRKELEEEVKLSKELSSKIVTLESNLMQKVTSYNEVLMGLSAEKARLEIEFNNLMDAFYEKDSRLLEARERLESAGLSIQVDNKDVKTQSIVAYGDLETMIITATPAQPYDDGSERDWSVGASLVSSDSDNNHREQIFSTNRVRPEKKASPLIADVIREYLHITATAVLLHFPEVNAVPSDELIKKAENLNFSCYYDVMMQHMVSVKEEKLHEAEKEAVGQSADLANERSSWLSRFFRLKEKRARKLSVKKADKAEEASGS